MGRVWDLKVANTPGARWDIVSRALAVLETDLVVLFNHNAQG